MTNSANPSTLPLRIAIGAQVVPNSGSGGIESVLIGLISALGKLVDGDEEYVLITPREAPHWPQPYLGTNMRIVSRIDDNNPTHSSVTERIRGIVRRQLRTIGRRLAPPKRQIWPIVPVSDGFIESLGCNVIHFPFQSYCICSLPAIFNPHDLQHRHYPQFFTPEEIASRETILPGGCRFAQSVAVGSNWVKQDIVKQYGIHPDKIQVIPWAPPTSAYAKPDAALLKAVRAKFQLPENYAFFPAMLWPHKNHLGLIEAVALLRQREGLTVPLVFTGKACEYRTRIEERITALSLQTHVKFLGLIDPVELRAVYRLAQFVAVPTLFEAASGPIFEAWAEEVPVTCSNVTSLPEQVQDAALIFDPHSTEAIANALQRMATDAGLREEYRRRGSRRLQDFSWERTAKAYRALYRKTAGRPLAADDEAILNWDWMKKTRE